MREFPEITVECEGYKRKSLYTDENIASGGKVYMIDIASLWESRFRDRSLQKLVWQFMNCPKDILGRSVFPKVAVDVEFLSRKDIIKSEIGRFVEAVAAFASDSKKARHERDFFEALKKAMDESNIFTKTDNRDEKMRNVIKNHFTSYNGNKTGTSFFKCKGEIESYEYSAPFDYLLVKERWLKKLDEILDRCEDSHCKLYLNGHDDHTKIMTSLLSILDILGLVQVRYHGGESSAIYMECIGKNARRFVLNNYKSYSCRITSDIRKRIDTEMKVVRTFFESKMTDTERWDFIEEYFLGKLAN